MQIVIEISEESYNKLMQKSMLMSASAIDEAVDAIKKGRVLPKHGRLIDADAFAKKLNEVSVRQRYEDVRINRLCTVADVLEAVTHDLKGTALSGFELTPTVIPAEKGEN